MRTCLRNCECRGKAAHHRFRDADNVMATGLRVPGRAKVVRHPVAAEVQLWKFRSIRVPLEDDAFAPVMPDWRSHDDVLVDEHFTFLSRFFLQNFGIESRESVSRVSVYGTVLVREE